MKRILLILTLIGGSTMSFAQHDLTIEASQNITNFKFTNSAGEQVEDYKPNYSGAYALGYRYSLENGLYFPVKLGIRSGGATYVYDNSNYIWDLKYFESRLGVGYNYSFGKFGAHFTAMGYYGLLLKANQTLNNEEFDIRESGEIQTGDFGVFLSPGVNFEANEYINIYLDLNYMLGLGNLETNESQTSNNTLMGATLGLAFSIK